MPTVSHQVILCLRALTLALQGILFSISSHSSKAMLIAGPEVNEVLLPRLECHRAHSPEPSHLIFLYGSLVLSFPAHNLELSYHQ